ncbi:MAG: HD domain-containing protein [Kofleriaceae bacterium]
MTWSCDGYVRALRLAAHWHRDQRVPGTELPYLVHVVSVCGEVQRLHATEPLARPDVAVQAALLHDILEDTELTYDALVAEVGAEVADAVAALSKDPALPKSERMRDSLRRILALPPEAAMVKLADRITNLAPPPSGWSREKCAEYLAEAGVILEQLGPASPTLATRLRARMKAYEAFT